MNSIIGKTVTEPAAVAAARNGARTVLIERNSCFLIPGVNIP